LQKWHRWTLATCATALLFLSLPFLPGHLGGGHFSGGNAAFSVLAQSVDAMSNVQTVHMTGRMRTIPGDNFELIGAQYDFVPLGLWSQYNPRRWRVEKTGRMVVMDGQSSTLLISSTNQYMKASPQAGLVEWLRPLLNPEGVLQNELDSAEAKQSDATVTEADGIATMTIRRKAEGATTDSWTKNKSIRESDHTCIYQFDSATKRLKSLRVMIHADNKDVVLLELNDIRYNEAFPDSLFALQIPKGATQLVAPEQMAAPASNLLGPQDVAKYFFNACAQKDWNAVLGVYPAKTVPDSFKNYFGHLTILSTSIGVPFKSGLYPGYFVPYEIRLSDGTVKAHNLAVRNDNPEKRWIVDGGF
jgi:outer membrane lipoprotein-sorting protein